MARKLSQPSLTYFSPASKKLKFWPLHLPSPLEWTHKFNTFMPPLSKCLYNGFKGTRLVFDLCVSMSCYMTEPIFITDCPLKVKLQAIQGKTMRYIHSTQTK